LAGGAEINGRGRSDRTGRPAMPAAFGRFDQTVRGQSPPSEARTKMLEEVSMKIDCQDAQPTGADPGFPRVRGEHRVGLGSSYRITQPLTLVERHRERWRLQARAKKLRPNSRVSECHVILKDRALGVDVVLTSSGRAIYKGLRLCGLLWECPLCASFITKRRRAELLEVTSKWRQSGGCLYHLVLTIPHHAGERLSPLLAAFNEARRRFFNRKQWKRLAASLGVEYSVVCREVTWGANGWHVHSHQILFVRGQGFDCWKVGDEIFEMWRVACLAVGLPAPNRRGVELQAASAAGAYLSKWGLEDEVTRSHIKHGHEGHLTAWDFLRLYAETNESMWGALYNEFCDAMHGSRQLVWSDGLRDWAGLAREKTDLELAAEEEDSCRKLGNLSFAIWLRVVQAGAQCALLEVAERSGWAGVLDFLNPLIADLPPPW